MRKYKQTNEYSKYLLTFLCTDLWSHEKIKSVLSGFSISGTGSMCDEIINASHSYHTHLYIELLEAVPVSYIKAKFPYVHIDCIRDDFMYCIDYVTKSGFYGWMNDKTETNLPDTFEVFTMDPECIKG